MQPIVPQAVIVQDTNLTVPSIKSRLGSITLNPIPSSSKSLPDVNTANDNLSFEEDMEPDPSPVLDIDETHPVSSTGRSPSRSMNSRLGHSSISSSFSLHHIFHLWRQETDELI